MMKKTFFSFAMAMVIALGMASCGNKADKAEGGDQATEGEKATEQAAAQDDPNTLSTDAFSMPIPEDFELNGKLEYQKKSGQIAIRTKSGVVPTYNFKIEYHPDIKYSARESQVAALKAIDPITVGNVTFKGGWNPDASISSSMPTLAIRVRRRWICPNPAVPAARSTTPMMPPSLPN